MILPMGIVGTGQLKNPIEILKRPRIDIIIGEPFRLPPHCGGGKTAAAAEATEVIMRRIAELLPPEIRVPTPTRPHGPWRWWRKSPDASAGSLEIVPARAVPARPGGEIARVVPGSRLTRPVCTQAIGW